MTEQEWLAIGDPLFLLEFFRKTSERKLRLFAVACCRRKWELLTDERRRRAVTAAEQFAEGLIAAAVFEEARWRAVDAYRRLLGPGGRYARKPRPRSRSRCRLLSLLGRLSSHG